VEIISASTEITVFVCANCARPGKKQTSAVRARPAVPDFRWPGRVQQIIIPCTGRLQPEHVLKAFESGSSVVSVVGCQEDNCHYIEGSRRCALRVDYIRSLLDEIGLGGERLLLSHLPGSASEDLALAAGDRESSNHSDSLEAQIAAVREQVIGVLRSHAPNPLRQLSPNLRTGDSSRGEIDVSEGDGYE
jgi:coenzyme F420-reducing hydrogenase delta subunit